MKKQRGYTLIELMISFLLGLLLIGGFGTLFSQTQKTSTIQRSLSWMTEDGRYALEIFGKELRRAGSLRSKLDTADGGGASSVFTANTNTIANTVNITPNTNVLGSTMSFTQTGEFIKGDNTGFIFRYQLNNNTELATNTTVSSDNSPCTQDVHLRGAGDPAAGDLAEDPATEQHIVTLYFYVANDATGIPTLYCKAKRENLTEMQKTPSNTSRNKPTILSAHPLLSNVTSLLAYYGIDTDCNGAANYYVDAATVNATALPTPNPPVGCTVVQTSPWQNVVSVRLSVVLQSADDNLANGFVTYTPISGIAVTATDKRLYREFSTTITMRNSTQ